VYFHDGDLVGYLHGQVNVHDLPALVFLADHSRQARWDPGSAWQYEDGPVDDPAEAFVPEPFSLAVLHRGAPKARERLTPSVTITEPTIGSDHHRFGVVRNDAVKGLRRP
jgi:hypothetical protein